MRAVRVGYLQQCVFFEDANGDSVLGLSSGEKSQPSGPKGEVSLYVEGETETTQYTIRQDIVDPACEDTLTTKKSARMLFSVAAGAVPTPKSHLFQVFAYQFTRFTGCDSSPIDFAPLVDNPFVPDMISSLRVCHVVLAYVCVKTSC